MMIPLYRQSFSLNSRLLLRPRVTPNFGLQQIPSQSGRIISLRPTTKSTVFPITIPVGVLKAPRAVGAWMLVCGLMCGGAVLLGGATRLTESGLSMVHWRFLGEKRPRTYVEWIEEFERYKAFPEYAFKSLQNGEMSLAEFKRIYWLEYIHRQWGRAIGLIYLLPAAGFALAGCFARPMKIRVLTLGALLGFEGLLGWYMVRSGLKKPRTAPGLEADKSSTPAAGAATGKNLEAEAERWAHPPRVSSYRLASHLSVAFLLFAGFSWTGCSLLCKPLDFGRIVQSPNAKSLVRSLRTLLQLSRMMKLSVFLTMVSGAMVAGLDAGLIYNTWPTMAGHWWTPSDYRALADKAPTPPVAGDSAAPAAPMKGWWRNACENPSAAQFHHRLLGHGTAYLGLFIWWFGRQRLGLRVPTTALIPKRIQLALNILLAFSLIQPTLGVLTLLHAVPVSLGVTHQFGSLALFASSLWLAHALRFLPKI